MNAITIEDQLNGIKKATQAALKSKESALAFLVSANIFTKDGKLIPSGIKTFNKAKNAKSPTSSHRVS